jgi:hypothetical protein
MQLAVVVPRLDRKLVRLRGERGAAQGRAVDVALPAAARRRAAYPRETPILAAHPTRLAIARDLAVAFARLATLPIPIG